MTAHVGLSCDADGCDAHLDTIAPTVTNARQAAWPKGWRQSGHDRDYCPRHANLAKPTKGTKQ